MILKCVYLTYRIGPQHVSSWKLVCKYNEKLHFNIITIISLFLYIIYFLKKLVHQQRRFFQDFLDSLIQNRAHLGSVKVQKTYCCQDTVCHVSGASTIILLLCSCYLENLYKSEKKQLEMNKNCEVRSITTAPVICQFSTMNFDV